MATVPMSLELKNKVASTTVVRYLVSRAFSSNNLCFEQQENAEEIILPENGLYNNNISWDRSWRFNREPPCTKYIPLPALWNLELVNVFCRVETKKHGLKETWPSNHFALRKMLQMRFYVTWNVPGNVRQVLITGREEAYITICQEKKMTFCRN